MPPKARFTKQQIVDAALQLFRDEGIEKLTARNLGKKLGSSACPIFTVFSSMEDAETAMVEAAKEIYKRYVEVGLAQELPFRGVGEQYIRFAANEPRLFQLLFMSETKEATTLNCILPSLDESYDPACGSGSLLLKVEKVLGKDNIERGFYGQEMMANELTIYQSVIEDVKGIISSGMESAYNATSRARAKAQARRRKKRASPTTLLLKSSSSSSLKSILATF